MNTRVIMIFSFLASVVFFSKGQEFDNPTLQQWTVEDAKYDDP